MRIFSSYIFATFSLNFCLPFSIASRTGLHVCTSTAPATAPKIMPNITPSFIKFSSLLLYCPNRNKIIE